MPYRDHGAGGPQSKSKHWDARGKAGVTWLDWFVRHRAELIHEKLLTEGHPVPRAADGTEDMLAALAEELERDAKTGGPEALHEVAMFSTCLVPFLRPFGQHGMQKKPSATGSALGFMLTRDTAQLLSDAGPPTTDAWRRRAFAAQPGGDGLSAIYVDVPHSALLMGEDLQIRAMLAVPWAAHTTGADAGLTGDEAVLVAIVVTARASERPVGVIFAIADADDAVLAVGRPDRTLVGFLQTNPTEGQGSDTLEAEDLYALILERGVRFFRLVLAFYRYGPAEARTAIGRTPAAVVLKNNNRPRKRESIFALVQLAAPSNRLGRPPRQGAGGWLLTARQDVSGHFKLQPHGPGRSLRQLIWVNAYERGPDDAPVRPRAVRF
jgi:hypothetical protein